MHDHNSFRSHTHGLFALNLSLRIHRAYGAFPLQIASTQYSQEEAKTKIKIVFVRKMCAKKIMKELNTLAFFYMIHRAFHSHMYRSVTSQRCLISLPSSCISSVRFINVLRCGNKRGFISSYFFAVALFAMNRVPGLFIFLILFFSISSVLICSIFLRYGSFHIQLVFAKHTHTYEHTHQINLLKIAGDSNEFVSFSFFRFTEEFTNKIQTGRLNIVTKKACLFT